MPSSIRALPRETIDRIAAGEVVERPASVLKELLENALDSGATRITLEIAGGGIELIRVSDDGNGISSEDLPAAMMRHSTSKISTLNDIEGVATFGFRGEALAAIASVSTLEIFSRVEEAESGWKLESVSGKASNPKPASREVGTTVSVRELFGRIPVRRKFLKTPSGEKRQLMRVWEQTLLAHPEIAFTLIDEGSKRGQYAASDLRGRVAELLGPELANQMIELSAEEDAYQVSGLCTLPLTSRGNRSQQFVFLGRRPIEDDRARHAIGQAYRDVLAPGRFPSCVLFLEVAADLVDVNVHPSKREVRFREPARVHSIITHAIGKAIGGGSLGKRLDDRPELQLGNFRHKLQDKVQSDFTFPSKKGQAADRVRESYSVSQPMDIRERETESLETEVSEYWQIENTFIITRIGGGLVIVDQHNAHERILYDQAIANLEGREPASQSLLFPHSLELSPSEMETWRELKEFFLSLGYRMGEFGPNTLAVEAIPSTLKRWDKGVAIRDILSDVLEEKGAASEKRKTALATYACKSAIKAGQILRVDEMRSLVEDLFETKSPYTCPHGRPIVIRIGRDELEKRFHRIVPEGPREEM
jgi:DNA mismatch repair protein MutL